MIVTNERVVKGGFTAETHTEIEGVVIELFKTNMFPGADWRPCKVTKNGATLWKWQKDVVAKGAWGELVKAGEQMFVVIRNKSTLFEIVSLKELATRQLIKVAGKETYIGGMSTESRLDAKMLVSEKLKIEPMLSREENSTLLARAAKEREAMQVKKANTPASEIDNKKILRQQERDTQRREILSRKKVSGFTADGIELSAVPVKGDEWECLPHQSKVVLVDDAGTPLEAFIVTKGHGGRTNKSYSKQLFVDDPTKKNLPEALRIISRLTLKEQTREDVPVFASMDDVKKLQGLGLNSGTWVAVSGESNTSLTVYAVSHDGINAVGVVRPKAPLPTQAIA